MPPRPRPRKPPSAAIAGSAGQEVTFSLALTQDQKDIRDWVHGFAADVMRPAAHEWDEREETPWPIIQEAAKIGLYGFEGIAQFFADPTGLGCRSSTRSCSGATPASACRSWAPRSPSPRSSARARASRSANGSRAASAPSTTSRSPRSAPPSPTPALTSRACARRAKFDEASRRVGAQRPEGMGDQRRHL